MEQKRRGQMTVDRGQKTEDRGQTFDKLRLNRGQRTEDRGQTFDKLRLNRGQRTEDRGQRTEPQKSVISIKFPEEFYITPFQGCISMALAQLRRLAYRGKLLSQTIIMKSRLDFI